MRTLQEHEEARLKMSSRKLRPVKPAAVPADEACERLIDPHAMCLEADLPTERALILLDEAGLLSAPVVDDNAVLVGLVNVKRLVALRDQDDAEVEDAMTMHVVTATPRTSIAEVARVMARNDLELLPIISDDGHLLGTVSALDVVRWLAGRMTDGE